MTDSSAGSDLLMDSRALLRRLGYRATPTRVAILDAFREADASHLTAPELVSRIADSAIIDSAHKTTVYRALDALTHAGVLRHLHLDGGITAYHLVHPNSADQPHLHAQCTSCGRIVDLPTRVLDDLPRQVHIAADFVLDLDHFALAGHCIECSA